MKHKNKLAKKSTFKQAVEDTEEIKNCYQSGLQALGKYSNKIQLGDTSKCEGSVDIDKCVEKIKIYSRENRWDYAFSYKGEVYFVEVHSAHTTEVSTVLRKLQWLKDWLNSNAPEIKKLQASGQPFFWIQSKGYGINKDSKQSRQLATKGLKPIPKLVLA
jgi:hypothetical protein